MASDPLMLALAKSADFTSQLQDYNAGRQQLQLGDQQQQINQAKINAFQADQAQEAQRQADIASYLKNPTIDGAGQILMKYPQQAAAFKQAWDIKDGAARTADLRQLGEVDAALTNGKTDLAVQSIQSRIDAEKAAGIPTGDDERYLAALKSGDENAIKAIHGAIKIQLASAAPDKFAGALKAVGGSQDKNTKVLNGGDYLLDDGGQVLFHAPAADKPEYKTIKNVDGSESIVQVGGNAGGGGQASGGSGSPLSTRLNNPGAIRYSPNNDWKGQVGNEGGFVKFATAADGAAAHQKLIANQVRNGYDTPLAWAQHYAPASDGNDPQAYAATVAKGLGIGVNDKIPLSAVPKMAKLSAQVESGGTPTNGTAPGGSGAKVLFTSQGNGASNADPSVTGEAFLSTIPASQQAVVKAIAEGRTAAPRPGTKFGQDLLEKVAQYDPTFDAANANSRLKTRQDFTSGKSAGAVNALNTAMGHLLHLDDQAHDLGNFDTLPGYINPIYNAARSRAGDTKLPAFEQTKQAAASEMRKVFAGSGGGNLAELEAWERTLASSQSYPQLHAAIANGVTLMGSRLDALKDQYTTGMGRSDQVPSMLKPSIAKKAAERFGVDLNNPEGGQSGTQSGPVKVTSRAQAMALPSGTQFIDPNGVLRVRP